MSVLSFIVEKRLYKFLISRTFHARGSNWCCYWHKFVLNYFVTCVFILSHIYLSNFRAMYVYVYVCVCACVIYLHTSGYCIQCTLCLARMHSTSHVTYVRVRFSVSVCLSVCLSETCTCGYYTHVTYVWLQYPRLSVWNVHMWLLHPCHVRAITISTLLLCVGYNTSHLIATLLMTGLGHVQIYFANDGLGSCANIMLQIQKKTREN